MIRAQKHSFYDILCRSNTQCLVMNTSKDSEHDAGVHQNKLSECREQIRYCNDIMTTIRIKLPMTFSVESLRRAIDVVTL